MKRNDILEKEAQIKQWISEHRSKAFICKKLHCKPTTLNSYLAKLDIIYKGNKGGKGRKSAQIKPAVAYLHQGSTIATHELKLKLIRDGIKVAQCESCYLRTWMNNSIPLELHHINGDRFDNRLENLKILCPNCHALTDNHAGKGQKNNQNFLKFKEYEQLIDEEKVHQPVSVLVFNSPESYTQWQETHPELQKLISRDNYQLSISARNTNCLYCDKILVKKYQNNYCSHTCSKLASRKVERPSKEELQRLVWTKPTSQLAKDFGVSDKAIEKWCKTYKIEKPPRGYWAKKYRDRS